jgi:hypothetical protein
MVDLGWRRGWIPPSGQLPLVADAWLPEEDALDMYDSEVVTFEDVEDRRCLLLIGKPGSGKSFTLNQAADRARATQASGDQVLFVDLSAGNQDPDEPIWV